MRTKLLSLIVLSYIFLLIPVSQVCAQADSLREKISYFKNNKDLNNQLKTEIELIRQLLFFEEEVEDGMELLLASLKLANDNQKYSLKARLNSIAGFAYINIKNDFEKGIKNYFKALEYYDQNEDYENHVNLLLNLASTYYSYGSFQESLKFGFIGINLAKEEKDELAIADFKSNLGACYADMGEDRAALKYWTEAASYYKSIGDELGYYEIQINIISTKTQEETPEEYALNFIKTYKEAIPIFEEAGYYHNVLICKKNMGSLLNGINRFKEAEEVLLSVLEIEKQMPNLEVRSATYVAIANSYLGMGNSIKEAEYLRLRGETFDELFNSGKTKAIAETRTRYQAEKMENENILLKNKEEIQAEKLKNEKLTKYMLFVGLGVIILIAIFVLNRFLASQKQKKIIQSQKSEVDLAYSILETKNNEILDSINYAKRIQAAILPPDKAMQKYLPQSFVLYEPKDIVAGDFYWLEPMPTIGSDLNDSPRGVLLAAADCTGHGVPGAMVSVVCNNGLNRSVREHGLLSPGDILDKTREIVIKEFEKSEDDVKDGMDIALVSIEFTKEDIYSIDYAGAHNPLWIIRKGAEDIEEIKANKQPIGKFAHAVPFDSHHVELYQGDSFYIFSDGFSDQFGGEKAKVGGKKLKTKNLKKLLLSIQEKDLPEQKAYLQNFFQDWKGDLEQLDDVCIIGVRV
jgi:serine phosphatase RsbU (regulator of sigma subunit)/tetratricopeptide (TPR) repeat protein